MPPKRTHAAPVTSPLAQPPDRQTTWVRERAGGAAGGR